MILSCCTLIVALAAGLADAVYYGSGTVGATCNFNTDCITQATMFCNNGACDCYSNYVSYQGYCYASVEPGATGCAYDFQCAAVWPGATCSGQSGLSTTDGTCNCPAPDYIPKTTRDGTVCVKLTDANGASTIAACPLPENGGFLTILNGDTLQTPPPIFCTPSATTAATGTGLCAYTNSVTGATTDVSSLYDCIEADPNLIAAGINGFCCPNRAFTCIQPKLTVSTDGSTTAETRYWYNSITGACEAFLWDPFATTVNPTSPNNFRTIDQCQSYCEDTCARGAPLYDSASDVRSETEETCTYTSDCSDSTDYACTSVGSVSWCCPTSTYVCSATGGLSDTTQALPNVGWTSTSETSSTRYYYNPTTLTCTAFTYLGNGGNFNNFLSLANCQSYCIASVCTQGNALLDALGNVLSCSSSTVCPTTHTCYNGNCCPTPRFVCQEEKRPGDGSSTSLIRYWWNQYTRQCEQLLYTGQNGNDNNFLTLAACQSYCSSVPIAPQCAQGTALVDYSNNYVQCGTTTTTNNCGTNYNCIFDGYVYGCCPIQTYVCSLGVSTGIVCNGPASTRYYYNTLTAQCTSFSFNGCDGNANNFLTMASCNNYCQAGGCPYGGTPYQATSSSAFQTCTTTSDCLGNYVCSTVNSGTSTFNYCCPSRAYICQQSVYSGANCGTNQVTLWTYNYATSTCTQFTFTGCAGSTNAFQTQQQCLTFCGSSACLPGETAQTNTYGSSLTCASSTDCGSGYTCRFDTLSSNSYCCGSNSAGVCNADQKAFIDPVAGTALQCTPSLLSGACYTGYNCQLNSLLGKYYCCTSLNGTTCPTNRAPYQINGVAQTCSLSSSGTCQSGFSCQSAAGTAYITYTGYCCTNNDVCPSGSTYYTQTTGTYIGSAQSCVVGGSAVCTTGYYCYAPSGSTAGYCCSGAGAVNGGCPAGQYVQLTGTSTYGQCNPFNGQLRGGCGLTYPSCNWSVTLQMYVCCGTTAGTVGSTTGGCPTNQVALYSGSSVVTCTSQAQCSSIQAGYFCQYSTTNSQLQCCAVQGTCTLPSVAYVDVNGNVVACTADSQCSIYGAYRCLGGNCCTSGTSAGCTTNQVLINGQCLTTGLFIGQSCTASQQCTGSSGAQCLNGFCSCPTGSTNSGNQCVLGCSASQVLVGSTCYNYATIGQTCTYTQQCQGGSTCTNGICACPAGQVNSGGVCGSSGTAPTCKIAGQTAVMSGALAQNCLTTACPTGTACEWNSIYNGGQYICCGGSGGTTGTTTTNRCTGTSNPNQVEQPSKALCLTAPCTAGYTCQYSTTAQNYVCCAAAGTVANQNPSSVSQRCPTSMVEQTGDSTCLTKACSNGYSCSYSAAAQTYICCVSSTSLYANAGNPASSGSSASLCTSSYLMYYNSNIGVKCNVDNDCVGTQYPKCLMSNTASYKVCCASGSSQTYGK